MKKTVLMLLAAGTWAYAGAQSSANHSLRPSKPIPLSQLQKHLTNKDDAPSFFNQGANDKSNERRGGGLNPQATGGVPCGSAYNLYGVLDANTTAVTVNQSIGTILFTHREDNSKFSAHGSGAYEASLSFNMGAGWDTSKILYGGQTTRYPSGVIFNPAGNTTFTNAYWVVSGPHTGGSATGAYFGWDSIAFGSMKFDSTFVTEKYKGNGKPGVLIEEGVQYMSSSDDSTAHNVGDGFVYNSAGTGDTYTGTSVNTGKFNSTNHNFDWTQTNIRPHLMPSNHALTAYDTLVEKLQSSGVAWSQDGKVGYTVIFGNLDSTTVGGANLNFVTYQPIVYKTTNSGATWAMMTPHNWRNDTTLVHYLRPTADSANVVLPLWHLFNNSGSQGGEDDYDLVVDASNNLHIFGGVCASAIANRDSSNQISYYPRDFLFDMHTTSTGGWVARYIDTLVAFPSQYCNTGTWVASASSPLAMGHRIQATRTLDGSKIFVTWLDDYIDYVNPTTVDSMQFPDLFGQGYDVNTGHTTAIKRFTNSADRYYICVSDLPYVTGSAPATYHIPVVRVEPPASANDGTSPVYFLYDTTDVYTDNDFVTGIAQINAPGFSITPNYPNPFSGITRFGVNLEKESTVDVEVYNMVGQKMCTLSPEKMGTGSHTITINGSGFAPGVYFYRVTVDGKSLTQKMIVE